MERSIGNPHLPRPIVGIAAAALIAACFAPTARAQSEGDPPPGCDAFDALLSKTTSSLTAFGVADLDGNGTLDVTLSDRLTNDSGRFVVMSGLGDGTFEELQSFDLGEWPSCHALADLDGDGDTDAAVSDFSTGDVFVLLGQGDGSFVQAGGFPGPFGPTSIAAGDLDEDGDEDLAVIYTTEQVIRIALGNGDGTFAAPSVTPIVEDQPIRVRVLELTGDSHADLLVQHSFGPPLGAYVYPGNGDGTLGAAIVLPNALAETELEVADLDGDEVPDLVVGSLDPAVDVYLGSGGGLFGPKTSYPSGTEVGGTPFLGDMDGDGEVDVLVHAFGQVTTLLGNGDGTLSAPTAAMPVYGGHYPGDEPNRALADFNGDELPDLLTVRTISGWITVRPGLGDGTLLVPPWIDLVPGTTGTTRMELADLDGDEDLDLVTFNGLGEVWSTLNEPGSAFATAGVVLTGAVLSGLRVADLNDDGVPDVVVSRLDDGKVSVMLGDGAGGFGAPASFPAGSVPNGLAVGDVTGDGRPDLLVSNRFADTISLLRGVGDGTFLLPSTYPAGHVPSDVHVTDMNGDGRNDAIVLGVQSKDVAVLLGTGSAPPLGAPSFYEGEMVPESLAVADVNRDGFPDVVGARGGALVSYMLNTGDGSLRPPVLILIEGADSQHTAVGDLDGDGRPDLVVGQSIGLVAVLWGVDGPPHFGPAELLPVTGYCADVVLGDANGDGRLDVFASTTDVLGGLSDVSLLLNACDPLWVDLGQGLAGSAGTPMLDPVGSLLGGDAIVLNVGDALASAPLTLVIGLSEASASFKGGVLVPATDLLVTGLVADGAGTLALSGIWPPGLPPGFATYYQAWITDAAGPQGLSASNAVRSLTP